MPIGEPIAGCSISVDNKELVIYGSILCTGKWTDNQPMSCFHTGDLVSQRGIPINKDDKVLVKEVFTVTGRMKDTLFFKVKGVRISSMLIRTCLLEYSEVVNLWITQLSSKIGLLIKLKEGVSEEVLKEWIHLHHPELLSLLHIKVLSSEEFFSVEKSSSKRIMQFFTKSELSPSSIDQPAYARSISTIEELQEVAGHLLNTIVSKTDDIFVCGCDSLQSIILTEYLHQAGFQFVTRNDLLTHPTPLLLWEFLHHRNTAVTLPKSNPFSLSIINHSHSYSNIWSSSQSIAFSRCVDCDPILINGNVVACCCHGGIFQVFKMNDLNEVEIITKLTLKKRVEKSLSFYKGSFIIGTYEGDILEIQQDSIRSSAFLGGEIRSSMSICESTGALCCYNGYLYLFDLSLFSLHALYYLEENCHCSPLLIQRDNELLIICCSIRGSVFMLSLQNSVLRLLKKVVLCEPIFASPIHVDDRVIICSVKGQLVEVNITTLDYTITQLPIEGLVYNQPYFKDDLILSTTKGRVYIINKDCKHIQEMIIHEGEALSKVIPYHSSLLVGTTSGKVYQLNGGVITCIYDLQAPSFSTPLVVNSSVCIGTRKDRLVIIHP